MTLPAVLVDAVERAQEALQAHPDHHLPLSTRHAILAAFGPRMQVSDDGGVGYQRRTWLDLITVRHALPLWDAKWPALAYPHEALAEAESILRSEHTSNRDERLVAAGEWWNVHSDFCTERYPEGQPEDKVLFAAIITIFRAIYDLGFDPDQPPPLIASGRTMDDGHRGPFQRDAAFYVSVAFCGEAPWLHEVNTPDVRERRRSYWNWWLTSAVPAAYASI